MCSSSPRGSGLAARKRRNASSISAAVQGFGLEPVLDAVLDFGLTAGFAPAWMLGLDAGSDFALAGFGPALDCAFGLVFRPILLL